MRYLGRLALVGLLLGSGAFVADAQQQKAPVQPPQPAAEPKDLSPLPPGESPARILSWDDCVALAAQRNPTLTAAEYAQNASRFSYYSSYNSLLPNLSLSNTFTHNNNSGGVQVGSPNLYTAQATAKMTLFNMSSIANIRATKASYSQAQANQRNASATLRFNLLSAFANVYFSQASLDMTRRIVVIQEKNADEVTLRYQSGNEYKGNMMNAKAQLLVAQVNVVQAVRSLRAAAKQLDQYLGLDEFDAVTVTGTLVAQRAPDLPSHLEDFLQNRPDVALQEAVVNSARASLLTSESPLFPNLSATFSRYREATYEFPSTTYLGSYGATLSFPIFGGGPASAYLNVKSAKNTLHNQEQALRAVRVAAIYNLENAWANYANAVDQAVGEQAVLESYRQRYQEGAIRYASGLLTFDNWQVIVTQWVGAEQTAITDWQQAVVAQAAWEQALGKALGE